MKKITFNDVKKSEEVKTYIIQADASLEVMGYTEHGLAHGMKCALVAGSLLKELGYDNETIELSQIAGLMHDIGNLINRNDHAHSGAIMAFRILDKMGMNPLETARVITAIGNHDEETAFPVNEIAAAVILADKTDVRRSRVRDQKTIHTDIHDRVNYAVLNSELKLDLSFKTITLRITIDTLICPIMEYFEIFLDRMILSRKAADKLGLTFKIYINNSIML